MKAVQAILFLSLLTTTELMAGNLENAERQAKQQHKFILLTFSGSDWCGPCIRMHNEVYGSDVFQKYANDHLVIVNADFPRMKKNKLSAELEAENNKLAEMYNPDGNFPYALLLSDDGKVISTWKGFYEQGADAFTSEMKKLVEKNTEK
jgi:thioredoxin-related protein